MVQRDVELSADGTTLRRWPLTPENSDGQRRTVVMAHGYSAGHVLVVGRHRSSGDAVVSQGLMVSGYQNIRDWSAPICWRGFARSLMLTDWLASTAKHPPWCPWSPKTSRRTASKSEPKRLELLPAGHFDIYVTGSNNPVRDVGYLLVGAARGR
jgi:hypothetical protein